MSSPGAEFSERAAIVRTTIGLGLYAAPDPPIAVYISSALGCMASADTTTVRVRRPDSERLQSLAKARSTTVIDVLHDAIDALERQEFLRGLNEDYQALRSDPARWDEYVTERRSWDDLA